jgi:glycosyltransferase involved in cell wall biosynthesis
MKVLEIATDAPPYKGGIARLVGVLIEGLRKRGVHVDVEAPRYRFREFKLSFIPLKKHDDYDVVHIHGPTPFLSDISLLTNGCSIVYTHHAEIRWLSENMSQLYTRFHRLLACRKARIIIVHSQEYARLFKAVNVEVVRPPVTMRLPKNFRPEERLRHPFTVIYVGQFRAFKGIDVLIEAASFLKDVNFILVGEGPLKHNFKRLVSCLGLGNVVFEDKVDDNKLQKLYENSNVVCLPSLNTTEAYGLVLIEGALHGCVAVASNLMGVRENLRLLGGFSFNKGSSEELVNIIQKLKSKPKMWLSLSMQTYERAVKYIAKYDADNYVQRHMELFRLVM